MNFAARARFVSRRARTFSLVALALLGALFVLVRPASSVVQGTPAAGAAGAAEEEHGGDIVFRVTSKTQKYSVTYRHETHVNAGIACDECHEGLFKKKLDGVKFKMADINKGQFCGACHTDTPAEGVKHKAFAPKKNCAKCHNVKVHDSSK
ncbi:MAG: hypothetical protein JNL90_20165 [Planctomycetes bacterium]|nr:hypothetical protein [Planctomycetota bacterium]